MMKAADVAHMLKERIAFWSGKLLNRKGMFTAFPQCNF